MTALTFDTLKYANTLKAAGFPAEQAEAQAGALSEVLEINLKELATKGDIASVQKDITALEQRIDSKLVLLEQRLTIKLGGMLVVVVGVLGALIEL
jgi:hypothetical protein